MEARRLIYLPIEPYRTRSSEYMSVAGGANEQCFQELGVPCLSIRPDNEVRQVRTGIVLDAYERANWGFWQIGTLIGLMRNGAVSPANGDVIYIEDFWQPGMEMLPYTQSLLYGHDPRKWIPTYAFSWAQSTDQYDFTHPMRWWMRSFEAGWASALTGVLLPADLMREEFLAGKVVGKGQGDKLHVTGLPYYSKAVNALLGFTAFPSLERGNVVINPSRWDWEKDPEFFCDVVDSVMQDRKDVLFLICTGAQGMRSNDARLLVRGKKLLEDHGPNVELHTNISKRQYFDLMRRAKVCFSSSLQDYNGYILCDAAACNTQPLYPDFQTYPPALEYQDKFLYKQRDVNAAKAKLYALLDQPMEDLSWLRDKFDATMHRNLQVMGFDVPPVPSFTELNERRRPAAAQSSVKGKKG